MLRVKAREIEVLNHVYNGGLSLNVDTPDNVNDFAANV